MTATIIPFRLDPDQLLSVFGRDYARVLRQRGHVVDVVALDHFRRPFTTSISIDRVRLAFGKRAASGEPRPLTPRGEDNRPHEIAGAFRQFAAAMAGDWRDVPSDTEPKERA